MVFKTLCKGVEKGAGKGKGPTDNGMLGALAK